MSAGFRTKLFIAALGVSAVSVLVAAVLVSSLLSRQTRERIERTLIAEARLVAELLSTREVSADMLDHEANRLGSYIPARVTFIGADGRVMGDSAKQADDLDALENHDDRPEVLDARSHGIGVVRRYSSTVGAEMLYVALPTRHPSVGFVRLARPLTDIREQLRSIRRVTALALGVALAFSLALSQLLSALLSRRVRDMAEAATRYAAGDFSRPARQPGNDELSTVSRVLDRSVSELGHKVLELARDRARNEAILAGMAEGVLVVDAQRRVQLANDVARRMLRADSTAVGRHYLESIRHPGIAGVLSEALEGRRPDGVELSLQRDPERTMIARAAPVESPGGTAAVLVLHDITDLRKADRMRRDFVANVSHELRTPLTAIRGYIEAIDDETDEEQRQRFVSIIARQAGRMERLVNDLLRLARLEAGQEPAEMAACFVEPLFDGVIADLAPVIEARGHKIVSRVGPEAALLQTDAGKLHDALRNLLENAVSYSPEGSTITLEAAREGESVVLSVSDEGPGIPPHDLSRVFERFYRVDKARSRESGGTGLGLSIVRHLVQGLGGEVTAANLERAGARFTIRFPAEPDEVPANRTGVS
jgi:two-component system, OmpR family, phosphate regulon sensor histidine kinase PhoR